MRYFGWKRLLTWPATGIKSSMAKPPGIMARPDNVAV